MASSDSTTTPSPETCPKKRFSFPHVYVLLFGITLLCAAASYWIPAGEFRREMNESIGREVVVPGTFHVVPRTPVNLFGAFIALQKGFVDAAAVVFFVFLAYASWFVVLKTGALHSLIGWMMRTFKGRDKYIFAVFIFVFGAGASVFGMFEETYGFLPLFVGMAIAMGYDAVVGMATVAMGVGMGYTAAVMNPFTVILAQKYADLPLLSGMGFRMGVWLVMMSLCVWWILRYAKKVRKDPTQSVMYGVDVGDLRLDHDELVGKPFTFRDKSICMVVLGTVVLLVWGVIKKGWYFDELCGLFVVMGVISGIIAGFTPNRLAETFVDGCRDIVFGALIVGISRSILVVLGEGHIVDSVVYYLSRPLSYLPVWAAAEGMLVVQNLINFFIPSGSGQAVVTMPIMAPLADLLHINRQVAVLAFQFGDGLSNIFWPTADISIICAIAHVPLNRWYRFFTPFFLIAVGAQAVAIAVAVVTGLQ